MVRRLVEVEIPEGMRLGFARDAEGGRRGLLFDEDTSKLVGHAELFEHEDQDGSRNWDYSGGHSDDSEDMVAEAVAALSLYLLALGIAKASPHIKTWWDEKAGPSLRAAPGRVKAGLKRIRQAKKTDEKAAASEAVGVGSEEPSADTNPQSASLEAMGPAMTGAEAQQRLAYAVVAMAFAREQLRALRNARITDEDDPLQLADVLNDLSPEGLEKAVQLMLEADPSMLRGLDMLTVRVGVSERQLVANPVPLSGPGAGELP